MPDIDRTHTTPNTSPRTRPVRCLVVHATVGGATSALAWLCNPASRVSADFVIGKQGDIWQLNADLDAAFTWHAGKSTWRGLEIDGTLNPIAIGIELANRNDGRDPYPPAQIEALTWLTRGLIDRYAIPLDNVVRHLDVSPGRETDPAGFPWQEWIAAFAPLPPPSTPEPYTADSAILAQPRAEAATVIARFPAPTVNYSAPDIREIILPAYWSQAIDVGIDPVLAIAQMAHETGALTSWWSARPRRNPAGIGVNGIPGMGCTFADWATESIPAHLGRLLAYATFPAQRTPAQQKLVDYALKVRPLPVRYWGCAPTLRGLNGTWAWPGRTYADKIAAWANRLSKGDA